jgi:hypothetical protein
VSPAQSKRGGHSGTPVTPAGLRQRVASRPTTRGCSAQGFCASGREQKCLGRGADSRNNAKRNNIRYIASKPRRALANPVLYTCGGGSSAAACGKEALNDAKKKLASHVPV